ncbi:MAG: hypothetical protein H0V87_01385 [Chloroflexi bacterium]|nr:hypothetical protein [Chloroflexota bacterium]
MDLVLIVLRLIHIVSGVLWVGGAFLVFRFVEPAIKDLGPQGEPFMSRVGPRLPPYFITVSGLTVLAGTALFWIDSGGDPIGWITRDATGLAFGIGGIAAWIAFLLGPIAFKPIFEEMEAAAAAMKSAGGPPTQEMVARMEAVQERLARVNVVDLVMLGIAVVTMAIARYL